MPRPRPPHLYPQTSRHGTTRWYVRRGRKVDGRWRYKKFPLAAPYGGDEFWRQYRAVLAGQPLPAPRGAPTGGTLAWGFEQYRQSADFLAYGKATRRQRELIYQAIVTKPAAPGEIPAGQAPIASVTRAKIIAGIDARAATPAAARHFLHAMHKFFQWAVKAQHAAHDPTAGLKPPKAPKTGGFKIWTLADLEAYEKRWPIGTRQRVWFDLILYSGLRRGDAVRLGRQHRREIKDKQGRRFKAHQIPTQKGGETIIVTMPILPVLERTLAAGPCGDLAYICGERGGPLTKESFGNEFAEACKQAGISKRAHGLRKVAATRAAQNGASEAELESLFGWVRGSRVAPIYTASVNREHLALGAGHKLLDDAGETDDANEA